MDAQKVAEALEAAATRADEWPAGHGKHYYRTASGRWMIVAPDARRSDIFG